jgi:hypothetical protein
MVCAIETAAARETVKKTIPSLIRMLIINRDIGIDRLARQ